MDFVDGTVITESTPAPRDDVQLRRRIGESLVDTLAALHTVPWREVGLVDFGKPDGFNARQLRRMRSLVEVDGAVPKSFAPLDDWLQAHLPPESATSIVHNDFRIGNMIVDLGAGCVAAVLDWELATIGDPLADLGYLLTSYPVPGEPLVPTSAMGTAVLEPGYPEPRRAARPLRRPHRRRCLRGELVCRAGDVQARRALRVQPQAVRGRCGRPLLRRSEVSDRVPGRRRAAGRCLISAEIDQMAASSRTFPPKCAFGRLHRACCLGGGRGGLAALARFGPVCIAHRG